METQEKVGILVTAGAIAAGGIVVLCIFWPSKSEVARPETASKIAIIQDSKSLTPRPPAVPASRSDNGSSRVTPHRLPPTESHPPAPPAEKLKSALGKSAHGMTFQEFKATLFSMGPALVKGVGVASWGIMDGYDCHLVDASGFLPPGVGVAGSWREGLRFAETPRGLELVPESPDSPPLMSVWLPCDQVEGTSSGGKAEPYRRIVEGIGEVPEADGQSRRIVRVEIEGSRKKVVSVGGVLRKVSVTEAYDHFSVNNQGTAITFVLEDTDADDVEKGFGVDPWHGRFGTQEQPVFEVPRGGAYGYKAKFLSTLGEPDRMATAEPYLQFEYQLRGGKVALSVFAPYWRMGVFWVRSLKYEGAYSD